jgi:3-dehydrotetronate 4-kinase
MKPYGIAATLSDAIALTAPFGAAVKIGIGAPQAADADILAPIALALQPEEASAALNIGRPQYIFTFGNTDAYLSPAMLGPVMDVVATGSGTDFLCASFASPWTGRTVYQGHLFQNGTLQSDLKRDLAPYINGTIAILPHETVAAGVQAVRGQLTALKERGIRLALLDAIDEDQCTTIAGALARQPVIAGPAWLAPQSLGAESAPPLPSGPLAILSGALNRQTLIQTAAARATMPVFDLDFSNPENQVAQALAWARPHFSTPFLITSTAPPDRIRPGAPAATTLAAIAEALVQAGIRNFLAAGNDTAAAILHRLGITALTAIAPFAGLRWLTAGDINILIKPGSYGSRNLFLYDFEPQSRLNESAE